MQGATEFADLAKVFETGTDSTVNTEVLAGNDSADWKVFKNAAKCAPHGSVEFAEAFFGESEYFGHFWGLVVSTDEINL